MRRWRAVVAGTAAALLIVVGYFVALHQPRRDQIDKLSADADQLRSQQILLQGENAELEAVAARADEYQAALARLNGLIPSGLAQDSVLEQLRADAEGAGVALVSVAFGDPQVPEGAPPSNVPGAVLVEMSVTVAAEGPYSGMTELLRRVEGEADRALLVGTVALTEAESGFPQVTVTWSGRAYALLAPEDPLLAASEPAAPSTPAVEPAPAQEAS